MQWKYESGFAIMIDKEGELFRKDARRSYGKQERREREEHMREDGMEYTGENTGTDGSEPKNEQGAEPEDWESAEIDRRMELLMTQTDGLKKGKPKKKGFVRRKWLIAAGLIVCGAVVFKITSGGKNGSTYGSDDPLNKAGYPGKAFLKRAGFRHRQCGCGV